MQKTHFIAAFAALALLSACNKADSVSIENNATAENGAAAKPLAPLPPSIVKTAAYRCDDGKTFNVDYSSDGSALLTLDGGKTVRLTGGTAGQDSSYSDDGHVVKTIGDKKISYTVSGKSIDCES